MLAWSEMDYYSRRHPSGSFPQRTHWHPSHYAYCCADFRAEYDRHESAHFVCWVKGTECLIEIVTPGLGFAFHRAVRFGSVHGRLLRPLNCCPRILPRSHAPERPRPRRPSRLRRKAPRSRNPNALIYLSEHEPDTLTRTSITPQPGAGVLHNVYETLVTYDKANPSKFLPLLAEYAARSGGCRRWQCDLHLYYSRRDQIQQGGEVSAEDVAYSLWRSALLGRTDRVGLIFDAPTRSRGSSCCSTRCLAWTMRRCW